MHNRITPKIQGVTLGNYHYVYVATDALLLPDLLENF